MGFRIKATEIESVEQRVSPFTTDKMTQLQLKWNLILLISLSLLISSALCQNDTATRNISYLTRIIGGDTIYEPIPYQISLQREYKNQWRHFCSGSIISPHFILTAAHCVKGQDSTLISVFAGNSDLKSSYGSRHYVQGFVIHEEFVPMRKCDIALVKVSQPFEFNKETIDAISFTNITPVPGGVPVVLTGWGSMGQDGRGPLPNNLQILRTTTLDNTECQKKFSKLQGTEMCTFRADSMGACNGDSGGPLVSSDKTQLHGIVAFGTKKCASGYPDVYTRVSEFHSWILTKMAEP